MLARLQTIWSQAPVLLTLTCLFWAGNAVIGRAVVDQIPPVALAQMRWTGAFLIVLCFAWSALKQDWPTIRQHLPILLLLSFLGVSAFNTMLYWGLQYTTAINATLVQAAGPLVIGLWSLILFRDALTVRQIIGIVLSAMGVVVIVTGGQFDKLSALDFNVGDLAVLAAIALYALYTALLRERPAMTSLAFLAFTIGAGAVLLLPVTLIEMAFVRPTVEFSSGSLLGILYTMIFPSVVAYFFFNRGVQLIGANRAGPYLFFVPLFGAVLSITFLGERLTLDDAIAGLLILAGVFIATREVKANQS